MCVTQNKTSSTSHYPRLLLVDDVRGFTIISMVMFHAVYDLAYIYGLSIPWFTQGVFQELWRCSISWTFLFMAGWMCLFSSSNFKRSLRYSALALLIYLATTIAAVDDPINFGIIYCMAACTLCFCILERWIDHISPSIGLIVSLVLFIFARDLYHGTYSISYLAWLGFPSPGFISGDYYPLIPYIFMYLFGFFFGRKAQENYSGIYPPWMQRSYIKSFEFIGKHPLFIYIVHQPLLLAIFELGIR